jgi:hypothetical protein
LHATRLLSQQALNNGSQVQNREEIYWLSICS